MDPLLYIEKGKSYHKRRYLGKILFIWSMLFLSLAITSIVLELPAIYPVILEILFLIFLYLYIANAIVKAIFLHIYQNRIYKKIGISFEAALAKERGRQQGDDVIGFITSRYGYEVMKRLGVSRESLDYFIEQRIAARLSKNENVPWHLPHNEILENNRWLDLQDYASYLHDHNEDFSLYLRNERLNRTDLLYSALLVNNLSALQKQQDRFWSSKKLHDLTPFEFHVVKNEKDHNTYITAPAIKILDSLQDGEKEEMLDKILKYAKKNKRSKIHTSDIRDFIELK